MTAEKKCSECRKEAHYLKPSQSTRPICRSCYLAHLKRLAAIYGGANYEEQRAEVLLELRRVEEDQR
jgi:hypothetical protein